MLRLHHPLLYHGSDIRGNRMSDTFFKIVDITETVYSFAVVGTTVVLALYCINTLIRKTGTIQRKHDLLIDVIPFTAGLLPFGAVAGDSMMFIRIFVISVINSGTRDPRVIAGGIAQIYQQNVLSFSFFLFFLAVWLVLRSVNIRSITAK